MASDLVEKAKEESMNGHSELAAELLTQAISLNPDNGELYVERAQVNINLNNFAGAVSDANKAIELNRNLPKAYLLKGVACMKLGQYQTAKTDLEKGTSLAPGESEFINLIKECDIYVAEETCDMSIEEVQSNEDLTKQVTVPSSKPKYRYEFYQKPDELVVTIFAKGVPQDCVVLDFGEQMLSVRINVPGEDAYNFQPRLFGKIIRSKCRYDVLSTKIEIRLAKAEPITWKSLEYTKDITILQKACVSSGNGGRRPTYPSSKPMRVDWDKLEAQVKKEEKEEKLDGDAALNKFFRDLYQDADDDTRRAMRKSFVESHGTVLSTNWKEVGSKTVEGSPPDGMELKKWEY
ncbi:protein SGT1 homolog [Neltuma alba]|uniref:protein SGT1 homolog n=1 Tax=Neltuma alba TaxID=207710 RepID=UPI0010A5586B|nr:protein SGT1 homolog [Prosopis alba]